MSRRHQPGHMPWDRTGNRLLVQSQLGQNRPTNYNIPQQKFVYGKLTYMDPQKSNDLMYTWNYHKSSDNKNIGKQKDLIKTNKAALSHLIHTAPGNTDFRKTQTFYKQVKQGSNKIQIKLPDQNHTYGKPGQLEDPIKLLMANDYGQSDGIQRHTFYGSFTSSLKDPNQKRKLSCHITKNHNLVKQATIKKMLLFEQARRNKISQQWKISRFNNVKAVISTNRKQAKAFANALGSGTGDKDEKGTDNQNQQAGQQNN